MRKILVFIIFIYACSDKQSDDNSLGTLQKTDSTGNGGIVAACTQSWDTVFTVYFKPKSSVIALRDMETLKYISNICHSDSFCYLKIVGYTDRNGNELDNDSISEERATVVNDYIDPHTKISIDDIYVTWLGESNDMYDLHFEPTHPGQNCVDICISIKRGSR